MATPSEPSGWELTVGEWNTDASYSGTGGRFSPGSVTLGNTLVAAELYSPWIPLNGAASTRREVYASYYVSSVAAGNNITIELIEYQGDRSTVSATNTLFATAVGGAAPGWFTTGSQIVVASVSTRWARFRFLKAATAFNFIIDQIGVTRPVPQASVTRITGTYALTEAAWTTIPIADAPTLIECSQPGTTAIYPLIAGRYQVYATVGVELAETGDFTQIRIHFNDGGVSKYYYGNKVYASGATQEWQINVGCLISMDEGDYVEVQVYYDDVSGAVDGVLLDDTAHFYLINDRGLE